MATIPVYRNWTAGEVVTAAYFNTNVRDAGNYWLARPLAVLRQASGQALATGAWTAITMDTEDQNRDGGHSLITNISRYTSQTTGYYLCTGAVAHGFNATGYRAAAFYLNGSAVAYTGTLVQTVSASFGAWIPIGPSFIYIPSTQYVEVFALQNSGGNLTTGSGSNLQLLWVSN